MHSITTWKEGTKQNKSSIITENNTHRERVKEKQIDQFQSELLQQHEMKQEEDEN
jgi:hypothetical protein